MTVIAKYTSPSEWVNGKKISNEKTTYELVKNPTEIRGEIMPHEFRVNGISEFWTKSKDLFHCISTYYAH